MVVSLNQLMAKSDLISGHLASSQAFDAHWAVTSGILLALG